MIPARYSALTVALLSTFLLSWTALSHTWAWLPALIGLFLCGVGIVDVCQTKQAIRRNYPILAHLRFFFEFIRPEIRQYFLEDDTDAKPFSRNQRSLVYQRAKQQSDKRPFGAQLDMYETGYEWVNHSISPAPKQSDDFRITIGGKACQQPYSASIFNISAMSFGALSANAILALNRGAAKGHFAHDTGEGSISQYHREQGGDLIWELGSGYFGCRTAEGRFDAEKFAEQAAHPQVKMIEIKLSQGAKPGHGGVLPGAKVTAEIAATRGVPQGVDCVSPAAHPEFNTPLGLLQFMQRLRELSHGKPVGFKLCLGHPWEWFGIAKAMLESQILPDFIVIDGGEGGTGAAPVEFTDHVGAPLQEGLRLVHNTLVGLNLRDQIKLGASGKIVSGYDVVRTLAIGADWCNAARGFMFALGCIQAQTCHTGTCPTGVTTQDPLRQRALVVPDKAERVFNFHRNTLEAVAEMVAAAGLTHPSQLGPQHIVKRISANEVRLLSNLVSLVKPGEILAGKVEHPVYKLYWPMASSQSFSPSKG